MLNAKLDQKPTKLGFWSIISLLKSNFSVRASKHRQAFEIMALIWNTSDKFLHDILYISLEGRILSQNVFDF